MIICLESSILGGYLSNEVPGLVTGLLHLAGRRTPTRIELEGNFLQDIAGCRVDFHNPCPEADPNMVDAMHAIQTGHSGIMTGSYRVASLPRRRAAREGTGSSLLIDTPGLKNLVFFEWFNENNQRVLIQSWHLHLNVSAPRWQLSQDEERRLLRQNRARRRHFLLNHKRQQSTPNNADPFAGDLMDLPPDFQAQADPFNLRPSTQQPPHRPASHSATEDEPSHALPDPFQRSEALAEELRRFERLLLFRNDVNSQPAVIRLLSTVADLAAHLSHTLRQFVTANRENWEYLVVDLEQSLPLFGAALSASEKLTQDPQETPTDRNWLGVVQSCLLSIELRMRELLSLLR
jgi:hypothetical protein